MAQTKVITASGVVAGSASHEIYTVNITKPGTGASSWTIYDNPSAASGTILAQGDGLAVGSFPLHDSAGTGAFASTGIYCAVAGTTAPTVVVSFD